MLYVPAQVVPRVEAPGQTDIPRPKFPTSRWRVAESIFSSRIGTNTPSIQHRVKKGNIVHSYTDPFRGEALVTSEYDLTEGRCGKLRAAVTSYQQVVCRRFGCQLFRVR